VDAELAEVIGAMKVSHRPRKLLLQIVHASRAADTALEEVTRRVHHIPITHREASLGKCLMKLAAAGIITSIERDRYQRGIAHVRNGFMHEAGRFPTHENEVEDLLSEVRACLAQLL
jgi:hypothetical protein